MFTRFVLKSRIDRYPFFWVLLIVMALISGSPAQAATFTVTSLADSGAGSLRQAVLDANAAAGDDTIAFQSGLTGTIFLTTGQVTISRNLTIKGPGAKTLAISSNKKSRVFEINTGAIATISGITIKEGFTSLYGGGIYNNIGTLTIINCNILDNTATYNGGGIHNNDSTLTIINSTIFGNQAGKGGGVYNDIDSTLILINNTFSGNQAGNGGGIYNNINGVMTLTNNTLSKNQANNGGGVYGWSYNKMTFGNNLIAGNTALAGKEIYNDDSGIFTSKGYNLFGENGSSGMLGASPISSDLILAGSIDTAIGPLIDNGGPTLTFLPVISSPAINAGDNSLIPNGITTDQRGPGFPRIQPVVNGTVDIGAVEVVIPVYSLRITKTGGLGTVTSNPTGIDCGSTCNATFDSGTNVTLIATPDAGYSFSGWAGDCTGTAPTCAVTMTAAKNVTALFANIPAFTLTVTKAGNGTGTVISTPAGINCGSDCSESYPTNTLVKLTAAPLNAGSAFVGWSGACAGTATPCTVKMDAAKTATANFKRVAALTVGKAGSGAGRISGPAINCGLDCAETYDLNTVVTLTATAYSGSTLVSWTGCTSNPTPTQCQVTMSAARTVTARFNTTTTGKTALTLYKAGVGLGTVTSTPAGITCGPTCPASVFNFTTGTTVVLNAVEMTGSSFTGWTGCTVDPNNRRQCTVVLNTGKVVSATFTRPVLTVRKVGSGLVATAGASGIFCGTDCTETYNFNAQATLVAIPATGFRFNGWSGCTADPGFPQMCTVLMNQSTTATASFIR